MSKNIAPPSRARKFIHWVAGILVAVLALGGFAAPAFAAGGSVTVFPIESGTEYNGVPVLTEGESYGLDLGYGSMDDGAVVEIDVPEGITIPESALVVPPGNTAIESITLNAAGNLVLTFRDPFPADVNQGVFGLRFTVDEVETAETRELVWNVDGEPFTQTVIVTTPGGMPEQVTNGSNKAAGAVSIPHTVENGVITFDPSVLDIAIPYTVRVSSADAREVTITDTLGANLAFVDGSLTGTKVIRDANGLNPVTTTLEGLPSISGAEFTHSFVAEANSVYTFQYSAKIADAEALAAIRTQLQEAYDEVDPIEGGRYVVSLTNLVTVNGKEHSTRTDIHGSIRGADRPGTGAAFSKTADPTTVALDEPVAAGSTLDESIQVTYTLGADLRVFAEFAGGPFELSRNVVIRDTLPNVASWNADADGFIVLTDQDGAEVTLAPAEGISGNIEAEIAADEYLFTYVVNGLHLYVNIGDDVTKNYTLTALAKIDALPQSTSSDSPYASQYRVENSAFYVYGEGRYERKGATTTITVPKDTSGGVDDPQRFKKTSTSEPISVASGTSLNIPYTFTIGQNVGDAASSRIIDVVDHTIFDVTAETLPDIQESITGTYAGSHPLDGDTFDVSIDGDGNLVIAPNAAFPKDTPSGVAAEAPFTGAWNITIELPTHVLEGKQTIDIDNAARYEGSSEEIVYTSISTVKATSFGDELEVRKHVYDAANDEFTTNLRAEVDDEGNLVQSEYIYRVDLIPHGAFSNMVQDVVDPLPTGVQFVGFVSPENVVSGEITPGDRFAIPGSSLEAVHDAGTVTIERGQLVSGVTVPVYFKVRVTEFQPNVGISNMIESVGATITPTNDYPLSLLKRDSTDAAKLITDSAARFSVLAADQQTVVLDDLRVVDGRIVTATGETPVVTETGTYWLREDVAPTGYQRVDTLSEITVGQTGGSADVVLFNTPGETVEPEKNYAIGDVTWIDANKDGKQDDEEQVLPGVIVELIKDGLVISSTATDEYGRYIFDELPAGEYQVKFTLTDAQKEIYAFTQQDAGTDDAVDSDADTVTGLTRTIILNDDNVYLTHDYGWNEVRATEGIDPTWDAGVIVVEPVEEPTDPTDPVDEPEEAPKDPAKPGTPGVNEMAETGGELPLAIAGLALLLMLAGAALFARRRRMA